MTFACRTAKTVTVNRSPNLRFSTQRGLYRTAGLDLCRHYVTCIETNSLGMARSLSRRWKRICEPVLAQAFAHETLQNIEMWIAAPLHGDRPIAQDCHVPSYNNDVSASTGSRH